MGYARHFMPLIGTDGQGQWWATAFGGHGMNTTAMGGILMARAIAAKDDEYRRFAPFAPQWAGGPFGRIGRSGRLLVHAIERPARRAPCRKGGLTWHSAALL